MKKNKISRISRASLNKNWADFQEYYASSENIQGNLREYLDKFIETLSRLLKQFMESSEKILRYFEEILRKNSNKL